MGDWVAEELKHVDIGDKRLDRRMGVLLERLSARPAASIPKACGGLAETLAAYRFFDNKRVTQDKVLAPHIEATIDRMRQCRVVLLLQDTTELDYTNQPATRGLGPLNWKNRIGLLKHLMLAVTPERLCLGVVGAKIWGREGIGQSKEGEYKSQPIEEKESIRWLEGYERACQMARRVAPSEVVSISDREGDIYEFFALAAKSREQSPGAAQWIVRANHDRSIQARQAQDATRLRARMAARPLMKAFELHLPRTPQRPSRVARLELRSATVTLKAPYRADRKMPDTSVNLVWASEPTPPQGQDAVDWLLLTSLPVAGAAQARRVLDYYCCRWQIELFFRTLKSGCRIERLQLENDKRLKPCIALYLIVAWRVLFTTVLARTCAQMPCTVVFEEEEWKSAYTVSQGPPLPDAVPNLAQMMRIVARLGGYLGRKSDGPAGPSTIWTGLQRVRDFTLAWRAFGPGSPGRGTYV